MNTQGPLDFPFIHVRKLKVPLKFERHYSKCGDDHSGWDSQRKEVSGAEASCRSSTPGREDPLPGGDARGPGHRSEPEGTHAWNRTRWCGRAHGRSPGKGEERSSVVPEPLREGGGL